jgi:hypothetical protein
MLEPLWITVVLYTWNSNSLFDAEGRETNRPTNQELKAEMIWEIFCLPILCCVRICEDRSGCLFHGD